MRSRDKFLSSRGLIQFQNTSQLTKEIWMTIWLLLALSLSQLTVIKVEILDQINYNLEIMKNWISTHQKGLSLTLCNRCLKILFPIPTRNKRSWHPNLDQRFKPLKFRWNECSFSKLEKISDLTIKFRGSSQVINKGLSEVINRPKINSNSDLKLKTHS